MDKKKDALEQRLAEDFKKLAEEEEQDIKKCESEDDIRMPEGSKEAIRAKLDDEIEKIRKAEKEDLYSRLSEEDRRALELGRKAMQEEEKRKTKRRRRPRKLYIAVAALVVAICGFSANAFGVQERMVTVMKSLVGDREIEQIDSSEDNLVIVEEDEEEAYQTICNAYGVEPVKLMSGIENKIFDRMEYDRKMQTAELVYSVNNRTLLYFINATYSTSSLGIDVEDKIVDQYKIQVDPCEIEVKEYEVNTMDQNRYSAQFSYQGLEYFLIGTMSRDELHNILNNLFFY